MLSLLNSPFRKVGEVDRCRDCALEYLCMEFSKQYLNRG